MAVFYTNRAAVDYLTVTFWDPSKFKEFSDLVIGDVDPEKCSAAKMMWYQGVRCNWENGSAFFGEGENNERMHHIAQISGAVSDHVAFALSHQDGDYWNTSRIDLQITIPLPEWYKSRGLTETLRGDEWPGRSRNITLIDGGGDDTVYIGSRHSDRYIRVYVKEVEWLRFEVEYKGHLARKVWERYSRVPTLAAAGILVSELARLPRHPILVEFAESLRHANRIDVATAKPTKTPSKTFLWFRKQVLPALTRLLNDHDFGDKTRAILDSLLKERDKGTVG